MKKRILSIVLCLVMVFSLLPFTASAASAIPINEETFPDPVFREYVLKIVGSSVLTEEKAQQIEVLDVSDDNIKEVLGDRAPITSLMGIRYLRYVKDLNCSGQELKKTLNLEQNSRVEKLNCSGNQLTGLWFHKGSSLRYLDCSVNQFTALNLSKNPELTELSCSNNKLTSLDLSANTKLQQINASSNKLTALDVRQLPELTHLYLWANHDLKSIDVSKNTKLEFLSVSHCKLTSLNVSNNRKLVELFVYNNQLTALDVRSNYLLKTLACYENQITALDLSSNVALEDLGVNDNPITELDLRAQSNLQKLSCSAMKLKKLDVDRCPKLRRLYCNDNQIETLDLRSNKRLETLYCQNNRLSWLNLSSNTALDPRYVDCSGNVYDIKVDENLQYKVYPNLPCYGATEGTYFTAARASDWTGGTVSKVDGWDVLTLDNRDVKEVTYKYDTGNAKIGKVAFTLKTEVPAKYITISFDPNGGTGTMKPMRVKAGVGYTLPECTFTPPEGKEFAGWLAVNGNVYPAGHDVFSTYDQSLKATWKDKEVAEVTISFDPNGGTGTMQPMKVKSGEEFELPECTFTPPEGKEFAGWLAENGKVYPAGDIVYSTDDSVLKATWKDKETAEVTISFDPNGGTGTMQPMKVKSGENFTLPECTFTPPEGKEFAGWLAANGTVYPAGNVATFSIDQTLKATWKDKAEVDVTEMFTDVTKNWAYPGIQYCVTHGIMGGMGDGTFAPTGTTTRAQIVQILYNLEGTPAVSGTTPFTDLTANWYKPAILWAYQNNVVAGTSPTTFAPDQPVTREQIAVILTQYMFHVLKMERTWTPADLSTFPDGAQVSSWAKEAMQDAVALGLINGTKAPDGKVYLDPQGSAARQQVATILMNFCQNVKK
ncbi:MAG: S-layer homology domain-containing protein [Oscillospiraceae bacterium]